MPSAVELFTQESIPTVSVDHAAAVYAPGALAIGRSGSIYRYVLASVALTRVAGSLRVAAAAAVGYSRLMTTAAGVGVCEAVTGALVSAITSAYYGFETVYGPATIYVCAAGVSTAVGKSIQGGGTGVEGFEKYIAVTATHVGGPCGHAEAIVAAGATGVGFMECM
jgi:hypothetical protein